MFRVGCRGRGARAKVLLSDDGLRVRADWRRGNQALVRNLKDRRTIMVFALPETAVDHTFPPK